MSMMTPPTQGWRASWSLPQRVSTGAQGNQTLHVSGLADWRLDGAAIPDVGAASYGRTGPTLSDQLVRPNHILCGKYRGRAGSGLCCTATSALMAGPAHV
jgi:hypothetical protein